MAACEVPRFEVHHGSVLHNAQSERSRDAYLRLTHVTLDKSKLKIHPRSKVAWYPPHMYVRWFIAAAHSQVSWMIPAANVPFAGYLTLQRLAGEGVFQI